MKKSEKAELASIPLIEWIVGFMGLLLVLGTISFLAYEGLRGGRTPPEVEVQVLEIKPQRQSYLVKVLLRNLGDEPAAAVEFEGILTGVDQQLAETSVSRVDYLPPRSEQEAGLFFTRDPRQHELKLRALGYEKP